MRGRSPWSTRGPASMNDVDTTEHWQTFGRAGTAPCWVQACSWSRRVLTNLLAQALGSAVHDGQGAAPAGQLAGNRDVGDHEVLLTLSEVHPPPVESPRAASWATDGTVHRDDVVQAQEPGQ